MLAVRTRVACVIGLGGLAGVVTLVVTIAQRSSTLVDDHSTYYACPLKRSSPLTPEGRAAEERLSAPARARDEARLVETPHYIAAKLRAVPERTGVVRESDWAKSYRMEWDGAINTWTTMRDIDVPSLDRRLLESVRPLYEESVVGAPVGATIVDDDMRRWVAIEVRAVVPDDMLAALAEVSASPDVERVELVRAGALPLGYD